MPYHEIQFTTRYFENNEKTYQLVDILTCDLDYWHGCSVCSQPLQLPQQLWNDDCLVPRVGHLQVLWPLDTNFASNLHFFVEISIRSNSSLNQIFITTNLLIWLYDYVIICYIYDVKIYHAWFESASNLRIHIV